ncbi:RNA-directed DNA polymerase, eukaryota [Tanacetum coccineum]|uniref:RNA-directed DNA polymerase, eukaryota n=1 Tax=Tanacetum coccineum TaxID=301880 RepID=A0ABQ5HDT8_9ASTR
MELPIVRGEKCKKGVVQREGSFLCQACEKAVEYPVLRYRLELDVSDKTTSTVVVMFDEPAIELVKCTADTLASAEEDVGFGYAHDAGLP